MLQARISLTLSRHFSLSFIASGKSSGLHPVSSHSCCMYVRAGHPAFTRLYVGVHRSTSLMSSSLLLHQCPACLVRLTWIAFVVGGRWSYRWCLVGFAARSHTHLIDWEHSFFTHTYEHLLYNYWHYRVDRKYKVVFLKGSCLLSNFSCICCLYKFGLYYCGTNTWSFTFCWTSRITLPPQRLGSCLIKNST